MNEREAENILEDFADQLENAADTIETLTKSIASIEKLLDALDDQEDLRKSIGVKFESRSTERRVRELQTMVQRLERELSDTSRKVSNIRW